MDLSHLVHGLEPKSARKRESSSRGSSTNRSNHESTGTSVGSSHRGLHGKNPKSNTSPKPSSSSREGPKAVRIGSASGGSVALACEDCNRTFESQKLFDRHSAVFHARAKNVNARGAQYPCASCGKAFSSPSKRTTHENVSHKGIRPFPCNLCDKSFGYRGDLTKHMITHSGAKPHTCYICGAKFTRNFYVKRHIENIHEGKSPNKRN